MMGSHAMLSLVGDTPAKLPRQSSRHRVLLSATLVTTTDEQPVKLRNLSASGALVEGSKLPSPGTDIMLKRGALDLFATVVWAQDGRAGVQFDECLSEAELFAELRPSAKAPPGPQPVFRRPGFHSRVPSEQDVPIAAAWARPNGRGAFGD